MLKKRRVSICVILLLSVFVGCGKQSASSQTESEKVLIEASENAQMSLEASQDGMKNVVILATGGTIAGKGVPGKTVGYKPGVLDIESLIEAAPGLPELANITGEQMLAIASDDITAEDWLALAKRINELSKDENIDGFVITHGTDTLEETAYFLNLTVKTNKPVVLVGSARPGTALSADGPSNLYQAVAVARSDEASGKGALVVFSGEIFSAREVTKVSTFKVESFGSRDFGSIGYVIDDKVFFYQQSIKPHTTETPFDISAIEHLPKVGVVYFHADADVSMLEYMLDNNEGLIIACAGNGGYSNLWVDKITEYANKGKTIPIVRSSRIANGFVVDDPDMAPTLSANNLNPQKARILLALALTKTKDLDEIAAIFEQY